MGKTTKKDDSFIKVPQYPGGKKALSEFIHAHLQYPQDALDIGLEGTVTVAFAVNDNGEVESPKVIKGLSPSCNDEAVRIVKLLKYGKAFNHGVRVKKNNKINIHFSCTRVPKPEPEPVITYHVVPKKQQPDSKPKKKVYSFIIE